MVVVVDAIKRPHLLPHLLRLSLPLLLLSGSHHLLARPTMPLRVLGVYHRNAAFLLPHQFTPHRAILATDLQRSSTLFSALLTGNGFRVAYIDEIQKSNDTLTHRDTFKFNCLPV